jgi:hypothetical protein
MPQHHIPKAEAGDERMPYQSNNAVCATVSDVLGGLDAGI